MKKRGQVMIFVVVGMFAVLGILGFFYLSSNYGESVTIDSNAVKIFTEECVEDSVLKSINTNKLDNLTRLRSSFKSDFEYCVGSFEEMEAGGLEVELEGRPSAGFGIRGDYLFLDFYYPLAVKGIDGEVNRFEDFDYRVSLIGNSDLDFEGGVAKENNIELKSFGVNVGVLDGTVALVDGENVDSIFVEVVEDGELVDDENIWWNVYNFGPDGATFDPPLMVSFDYSNLDLKEGDEDYLIPLGWDSEDSAWYFISGAEVDFERKVLIVPISHFSNYTYTFIAGTKDGGTENEGLGEPQSSTFTDFESYYSEAKKLGFTDDQAGKYAYTRSYGLAKALQNDAIGAASRKESEAATKSLTGNYGFTEDEAKEAVANAAFAGKTDEKGMVDHALGEKAKTAAGDPANGEFGTPNPDGYGFPGDVPEGSVPSQTDDPTSTSNTRSYDSDSGSDGGSSSDPSGGGMSGADNSADCFAFDELVLTPFGYVEISKLKEGDTVVSYDEMRDSFTFSKIADVLVHDGVDENKHDFSKYNLINLTFEDRFGEMISIRVTENHYFYNYDLATYMRIGDFEIGDYLYSNFGRVRIISKDILIDSGLDEVVYNLHMEEAPYNYLVRGVVVHNWK